MLAETTVPYCKPKYFFLLNVGILYFILGQIGLHGYLVDRKCSK